MARLKSPLFSLGAIGRLGKRFTVTRRLTGPGWLLRGRPTDPRTEPQLSWRTMWQLAADLWHGLPESEILEWERAGTRRGMTGFAWYMSQALRPNPGIYLPLAGGDMTGVIDMQANHIHGLPNPVHITDATRKQYVDQKVREEVTRPGARVRRTTDQDIPHNDETTISFNMEYYDNDDIWEGVTNPDRLTIKTAGIYLIIGQVHWSAHSDGYRRITIQHSVNGPLAQVIVDLVPITNLWRGQVTTTWDCIIGDYFELRVYQNSGVQLQALAHAEQAPVLSAVRIG